MSTKGTKGHEAGWTASLEVFREGVPEACSSAGRVLGFLSSLRYARNDRIGALRSESLWPWEGRIGDFPPQGEGTLR